MSGPARSHGLAAEFADAAALLEAARRARAEGYRRMEACSPLPVADLAEVLELHDGRTAALALAGGIAGGLGTFALQWYSVSTAYPLDVGDRTPLWPGLIPSTFEMTILGAALCVFFGTLLMIGLPRLNHPLFDVPEFARASRDRFFLCIECGDPIFDAETTRRFLEDLGAVRVTQLGDGENAPRQA